MVACLPESLRVERIATDVVTDEGYYRPGDQYTEMNYFFKIEVFFKSLVKRIMPSTCSKFLFYFFAIRWVEIEVMHLLAFYFYRLIFGFIKILLKTSNYLVLHIVWFFFSFITFLFLVVFSILIVYS